MKLRMMLAAERLLNRITKTFGMRVILSPQSALHSEPISFRADGLITSHTVNFLEDARFTKVIESIRSEVSHSVYHLFRIYIAIRVADLARSIPNSVFVECGVGEGINTLAINRYFGKGIPHTFLIDTFSGIDASQLQPNELQGMTAEARRDARLKSYPTSDYDSVKRRFAAFPHVSLIKGSVPGVLEESRFPDLVSWLHIDMNNAAPEYAALKFFWPRMTCPGFVLFDDYAFKGLRPQKDAIDRACGELGISIPISLPTGQGLLIKTAH